MGQNIFGQTFKVVGTEEAGGRAPTDHLLKPRFEIRPTNALWSLVGIGILVTTAPLLARNIIFSIPMILGLLYVVYKLARIIHIGERRNLPLRNNTELLLGIPYNRKKQWYVVALLSSLSITVILGMRTFAEAMQRRELLGVSLKYDDVKYQFLEIPSLLECDWRIFIPIFALSAFWCIFAKIWMSNSPTFRLKELEGRYDELSLTVKEKITFITDRKNGGISENWQESSNFTRSIYNYALATTFFSIDYEGAMWKKSMRALPWYYAPVTVPLIIIVLLPIIGISQSDAYTGIFAYDLPKKQDLALSALTWAAWAVCMFSILAERDFGASPQKITKGRYTSDVEIFQFGDPYNYEVLSTYIEDKGQSTMNAIVLVIVPLLYGYFGLFY